MPLQTVNGKLLLVRTKPVKADKCCCCPTLEGVRFRLSSDQNHQCDCARFDLYVNDVRIGLVDFNNGSTGGVITVNHTITKAQADEIAAGQQGSEPVTSDCCILSARFECLSYNGDQYGCDYFPFCHPNISYALIFNAKGQLVYDGPIDVYPVNVDICKTIERRFNCDSGGYYYYGGGQGCVGAAEGDYATIEECEQNCVAKYNCSSSYGCTFIGWNASGGYSREECLAACVMRYTCDAIYGCYSTNYATTGMSYEACAESCEAVEPTVGETLSMQAAPVSGITVNEDTNSIETLGSPQERENMRRLGFTSIAQMGAPPVPAINPTIMNDPTGPGTFLSKMLEKIGIKSSPNCSCKARAYKMNEMGPDWCEQNIDTVVGWLREEATKRKLPFVDFAGKLLVKRAIKLSRAALAKAEQQCDEPDTPPLDSDSQAGAG